MTKTTNFPSSSYSPFFLSLFFPSYMLLLIHVYFPHWEMKDIAKHFRTDYFKNFQVAETSLKLKHLSLGFRNLVRHTKKCYFILLFTFQSILLFCCYLCTLKCTDTSVYTA